MVKALFDTNILIDYLNGIKQASAELDRYEDKAISLITWMEVMVGAPDEDVTVVREFLGQFINLPVDQSVGERAVFIRKKYKLKLPDAFIWATAQSDHRILVTRNTKDFGSNEPGIRVPYNL